MGIKIQNSSELTKNAPDRSKALEIIEAGLDAVDTQKVIESSLSIEKNILKIKDLKVDLRKFKRVRVIGFGKVSCVAAVSLEKILGEKIRGGVVIDIRTVKCNSITTLAGTHPFPSPQNVEATKRILELIKDVGADDLVIVIVSGGGSALLCWPQDECDQGEKLYSEFLKVSGTINELNVVRKHISSLKGGGLAKLLFPAAVVGLIFCDIQEDGLENVASGPTFKDKTAVQDAQAVLDKYGIRGFRLVETPKEDKYFERVHNVALVSNIDALTAMADKAKDLGFHPEILSAKISGSAEETISGFQKLKSPGSVILGGGEIRLAVKADGGSGGRNLYLALSSLLTMEKGDIFISVASDGLDNSDAAGAIADAYTSAKAKELGLDIKDHLARYDAYDFFKKTVDLMFTGPTGANVSDLMILSSPVRGKTPLKEGSSADHAFKASRTSNGMNGVIKNIIAEEILDSRGNPTLKVTATTSSGQASFSVPSGASVGKYEAHELRDGDKALFNGLGVKKAIKNVNEIISPALAGKDAAEQNEIDRVLVELDGTPNKKKLGGNAVIGASVACAKAAARSRDIEVFEHLRSLAEMKPSRNVPFLFMNLVNGGKHASSRLAFQEYHIVPQTDSVEEALDMATDIQRTLKELLVKELGPEAANLGDEGGFAPDLKDTGRPLELLVEALRVSGFDSKVKMALDTAASSFYDSQNKTYFVNDKKLSFQELKNYYQELLAKFPIMSIEDPFEEDDFDGFADLLNANPGLYIVGDDLTVTNPARLKTAMKNKSVNAVIIKPNQIGTLTETLATMKLARENDIECIVSHRSGETEDDFIADLAYAFSCFGLKAGAPQRGERVVKYNRLKHIADTSQKFKNLNI